METNQYYGLLKSVEISRGKIFDDLMNEKGLSTNDLINRLEEHGISITKQAISKWRNQGVSSRHIEFISKLFDVDIDYLLCKQAYRHKEDEEQKLYYINEENKHIHEHLGNIEDDKEFQICEDFFKALGYSVEFEKDDFKENGIYQDISKTVRDDIDGLSLKAESLEEKISSYKKSIEMIESIQKNNDKVLNEIDRLQKEYDSINDRISWRKIWLKDLKNESHDKWFDNTIEVLEENNGILHLNTYQVFPERIKKDNVSLSIRRNGGKITHTYSYISFRDKYMKPILELNQKLLDDFNL